jgi:hypothetical protein
VADSTRILTLQRAIGNQAVGRLLQRVPTIGALMAGQAMMFLFKPEMASGWHPLAEKASVHLRRVDVPAPKAGALPPLAVVLAETSEVPAVKLQSKATTGSRLFLSYAITPRPGGTFRTGLVSALLNSKIEIRPLSGFASIEEFAPHYQEFRALAAALQPAKRGKSEQDLLLNPRAPIKPAVREQAVREFCAKHLVKRKDENGRDAEPQLDFPGPRSATLQHEVEHIRDAEKSYHDLAGTFLREAQTHVNAQKGISAIQAEERFIDFANIMWRTWNSDTGHTLHEQIYLNQCRNIIGQYEANVLKLPQKPRGRAKVDPLLAVAERQLGGADGQPGTETGTE